jgi:HlyD family secretion protein
VQAIYADFNSVVRAGQVLARLEPSLFQAQVDQAKAAVVKAEADVEAARVSAAAAQRTRDRNARLAKTRQIAPADLDAATAAAAAAKARTRAAEAALAQARAGLRRAQVNLERTVIRSPIDGLVLARSVDAGQTVAARVQAPTLFVLAADLEHMRVNVGIDEADAGVVKAGEPVTFSVDAYPEHTFSGRVEQVRLEPTVTQNVVTYLAVIDVDNPGLKLRPGMTAIVSIETARRDNVLTVPATALRFRPSAPDLEALGAVAPDAGAAPVPAARRPARAAVWRYDGERAERVSVVTGLSDGAATEILRGPLTDGDAVVIRVDYPTPPSIAPSLVRNPLLGGRSRGRWRGWR